MNHPIYRFSRLRKAFGELSISEHDKDTENLQYEFFYNIFNWKPEALEDPKYEDAPPNELDLKLTPLRYKNTEEYKNIMFPIILYELWSDVRKEYQELKTSNQMEKITYQSIDRVYKKLIRVKNGSHRQILLITMKVITTFRGEIPRRGDLVQLYDSSNKRKPGVFAYVMEAKRESMKSRIKLGLSLKHQILTYELMTNISVQNSTFDVFSLKCTAFILGYINQISALTDLHTFSLNRVILTPTGKDYQETQSTETLFLRRSIKNANEVNETQSDAILQVLRTIKQGTPKITLIQGPPGTGKSKTIVKLVESILELNLTERILVCAPSNKAIDSLVLKFLEMPPLKRTGNGVNLVRIGDEEKIDESVKHLSLPQRAERERNGETNLHSVKGGILLNAEIITSTLTSCYTTFVMSSTFGCGHGPSKIKICIIDEAAQAKELETWVPLLLGVEHLILVGDHKQLPPIILSKAKDYGYETSFFARAQQIFSEEGCNPIIMLDTQYRMANQISQWPNHYFYDGALKNGASLKPWLICNYVLFNHNFIQTENGHGNRGEAHLIVKCIKFLKKIYDRVLFDVNVGIITPYHDQRIIIDQKLKNTINDSKNSKKKGKKTTSAESSGKEPVEKQPISAIEVNTVDSFQGSERDIIILSCVRSHGTGFTTNPNRLNVSLTRAKYTLILFGNFKAFKNNTMWSNLVNDAKQRGVFINIDNTNPEATFKNHTLTDDGRKVYAIINKKVQRTRKKSKPSHKDSSRNKDNCS